MHGIFLPKALSASLLAGGLLVLATAAGFSGSRGNTSQELFEEAEIFFEYNDTDGDLGVHVFLDGDDWNKVRLVHPNGKSIFEVKTKGAYEQLGLSELFFEGAEPELSVVPLAEMLGKFPEGTYLFKGKTVDGDDITGEGELSHAIPDGPETQIRVSATSIEISWMPVTAPPTGFPNLPINIVGYEVIVDEEFRVTLDGSATSVTLPPEFVAMLEPGEHEYEVLAIEEGGNKSITEEEFIK
jgi:hypothetical protein